jgi:FkbM family methyltransferase
MRNSPDAATAGSSSPAPQLSVRNGLGRGLVCGIKAQLWKVMRHVRPTITIRTCQGVFTVDTERGGIGKILFTEGGYELELMQQVKACLASVGKLPAQGTVLDIGANMGVTSISFLRQEMFSTAIAIEPDPSNFRLLLHNVRQNELADRVLCLPFAVSSRPGPAQLELNARNHGDHRLRLPESPVAPITRREPRRESVQVNCARLDDLVAAQPRQFTDNLALIWMDVQGHEAHALLGARNLISKGIPLVAEIWPYALKRAGTPPDCFCQLAGEFWTDFWVSRQGRFVPRPISALPEYFAELGDAGTSFENVVFTRQ